MNTTWTVSIERLEIQLPVGVYDDELLAQPLWVSLKASACTSASPGSLGQCLDYAPLCHWLTRVWPATPHTPLLETRMNQLFAFVFSLDDRVTDVWAGMYKQRMSRQAWAVGMERRVTRAEFHAQQFDAEAGAKRRTGDAIHHDRQTHASTTP